MKRFAKSYAWPVGAALVFVILLYLLALSSRNLQPQYQGKTIDEWIYESFAAHPKRNPEAIEALYAIGEPALQRLIEMVETDDTRIAKEFLKHSDRMPAIQNIVTSRYWYRYLAAATVGELGTNAAVALSALRKLANDSDPNLVRVASAALVLVQNESISNYIALSLDYENTNSTKAYGIILSLGSHAKEGIPSYLQELESTNSRIRIRALMLLNNICTESPECIAVYTNLLASHDRLERSLAMAGLANCGELAKHIAPLVVNQLSDSDSGCRSSAMIFFLWAVPAQEFGPYAAAVSRATNDVDQTVRELALKTLREKRAVK